MGGRGRSSGVANRQVTLEDVNQQNHIREIIEENDAIRNVMTAAGGGVSGVGGGEFLKKCECCGEYTLPFPSSNHKCFICGWIDDLFQNANPNSLVGENPITLKDARSKYFI